MTTIKTRSIARSVQAQQTLEGDGVQIRRAFPSAALEDIDPFLLLDEMGPLEIAPGGGKGFPEHPHRGFETVTYMLEGQMEHRDSIGSHGIIGPGDVQWMTAGSGVVHSEMPGSGLARSGGRLHGFQLWVNLPRRDKMTPPRYQELPAARIPVARNAEQNAEVRIIAGEALGQSALIQTHTPITYLHFTLQPGAEHTQPVPRARNAFAYVISGEAVLGSGPAPLGEGHLAVFSRDADDVVLANPAESGRAAEVLLVAGEPLSEPVVRWGPFVMNTRDEIAQAFDDYRSGRLGRIA